MPLKPSVLTILKPLFLKGGAPMENKKLTRRKFLEKSAKIGTGLAVAPLLAPAAGFFTGKAHAAGTPTDTVVFLSAENITGNWDPTSHTTLAQLNVEAFVFNYLTRCPIMIIVGLDSTMHKTTSIKSWAFPIGGRIYNIENEASASGVDH